MRKRKNEKENLITWCPHSARCAGVPTDLESSKRAAFDVNVAAIRAHNALADKGGSSYRLGVNEFSDLTEEEFASRYVVRCARAGCGAPRHAAPCCMLCV